MKGVIEVPWATSNRGGFSFKIGFSLKILEEDIGKQEISSPGLILLRN